MSLADYATSAGTIPGLNASLLDNFPGSASHDSVNLLGNSTNDLDSIMRDVPDSGSQSALGSAFSSLENSVSNSLSSSLTGALGSIPGVKSLADTLNNVSGSSGPGVLSSEFWTNLFLRGVVIILGFIFVAVGLTMFKTGNSATTVIVKGAKAAASVAA